MDIDLSKVDFIDSTGLRTLISLKQRAHVLAIEVHFLNPSSAVKRAMAAADLGVTLD